MNDVLNSNLEQLLALYGYQSFRDGRDLEQNIILSPEEPNTAEWVLDTVPLLQLFGVLELGLMLGLVTEPLPSEISTSLLEMTKRHAFKRLLPDRRRLLADSLISRLKGVHNTKVSFAGSTSAYAQIVSIDIELRANVEINWLLRLIAHPEGRQTLQDFFREPNLAFQGIFKEDQQDRVLDTLLTSFDQLFRFAWEVHTLLQSVEESAVFQSAIWSYYAPYFWTEAEFIAQLPSRLLEWQAQEDNVLLRERTRHQLDLAKLALNEMTNPQYQAPLRERLRDVTGMKGPQSELGQSY
jgi:hypothetical protein